MSTLWTPEGEHEVAGSTTQRVPATPPSEPPPPADQGPEKDQDLEKLERELVATPVEAIIANHCFGLFQLAALHLSQRPPNLDEARLAIDAFGAIVDTLGERLGESAETLRGALSQARLAFVELSAPPPTPGTGEAASDDATEAPTA